MKMEIVNVDPKDYRLEIKDAEGVSSLFQPMFEKMKELEKEGNEILKLELTLENCKVAKSKRLEFVKVRTETAKLHKQAKADIIKKGRLIDGFKNAQLMAGEKMEKALKDFETHFERMEAEKIEKLRSERASILHELGVNPEVHPGNIGEMELNIWEVYLNGIKAKIKARKEAEEAAERARIEEEKKAEEERIRAEKIKVLHEKRMRELAEVWQYVPADFRASNFGEMTENDYLKFVKAANRKKTEHEAEQAKMKAENERKIKEAKERERLAQIEAEKMKAEQAKMKAQIEENKRKERQRLEAKEAELKRIEAERIAKEQAELNKGDEQRVKDLIVDLEAIKTRYLFQSGKNKIMFKNVCSGLDQLIKLIK